MALLLRGGIRLKVRSQSAGFALPTILIASVVMLIVLLVSVGSTTAVRTAIQDQYYTQLAQAAGDAGVAYAQACMNANGGVAKWTDSKPLTPSTDCNGNSAASPVARVLVVAGGGGGGSDMGGGGGGGGVLANDSYSLAVQSYSVTVGAGGAGAPAGVSQARGTNGGNSVFGTMTAVGGGGGGSEYSTNASPPGSGGSAGGTASCNQTTLATSTAGQGYDASYAGCYYPSGGGGAGGPGAVNPGNGGPGEYNDILGVGYYWGGGGGGSGYSAFGGNGGIGGGGGGAIGITTGGVGLNNGSPGTDGAVIAQSNVPGGNAGANTGGGGGGGSHYNSNNKGGNGGSGIVVISYPTGLITATGGTISTSGTNTIHTFLSSGTFSVTAVNNYSCPTDPKCFIVSNGNVRSSFSVPATVLNSNVRALIVAGGGSGGGSTGGGGGAGGVLDISNMPVGVTGYPIVVGAGGAVPGNQAAGRNGGDSSFNGRTATGGGGGGYSTASSTGGSGQLGGSGGGGQSYYSIFYAGAGTLGQGNAGGPLTSDGDWATGGGGAGSGGSVGITTGQGGRGGNGLISNITGTEIFYGGGGGGGGSNGIGGLGGSGGGGNGGNYGAANGGVGAAGTANTGGGGGGGWDYATGNGGAGGSGVVIISYPTGSLVATGGSITTSGGNTIHTFTSSGTFTVSSVVTKKVIPNTGYVEILRNSNQSVWRRYEQPAAQSAAVPDLCSGATGSVYGWTNASVRTPKYFIDDTSALGIGLGVNDIIAGPAFFRKDFSITTPGNYTLTSAGDANLQWYIDGNFVANWNSTTQASITVNLTSGCHVLMARATNETVLPDSSDFRASLKLAGSPTPIVVSDSTWRVSTGDVQHYSSTGYYASPAGWTNAREIRLSTSGDANWLTQTSDAYARFIASPQNYNYAGVAGASPFSQWTNFRDGKKVTVASNTQVKVGVQCDDNCIVYMDGQAIISSAPWSADYTTTVTLTPGDHQFGIALNNTGTTAGASGFSFAAVRVSDGVSLSVSDATWMAANYWNAADQNPYSYDANFTSNPEIRPAGAVRVLVVGGGGGGGANMGGGGGGGGVVYDSNYTVRSGSYNVTVGVGGHGAPAATGAHPTTVGSNGGNSVFDTITAYGGGRGGTSYNDIGLGISSGATGASGGGASGYNNNSAVLGAIKGGLGISGQGNNGGNQGVAYYSGGGGGAGGAGVSGNGTANGGIGVSNSILGTAYYWGGGGGGSGYSIAGGAGGAGGGGGGAVGTPAGAGGTGGINNGAAGTNGALSAASNVAGGNGGANTGGGGGGGSHYTATNKGGDGGSGIVVISYPTPPAAGSLNATGGTITTSGGYTIHTFTTNGTFTVIPAVSTAPVTVLAVGGGGSGGTSTSGSGGGGGGGAGGLNYSTYAVGVTSYPVIIGAGGAGVGVASTPGNNGGDTTFGVITVKGGGGGGKSPGGASSGNIGGSGGGAGYNSYASAVGAFGIMNQGNKGGDVLLNNNGGGGGGAGGPGGNTNSTAGSAGGSGGVGGAGRTYTIAGSSATYARGGDGGTPPGGAYNGVAGTGNGGSGIYGAAATSGAGGSGVVLVMYPTGSLTATGGSIINYGGMTIHTFTSSGTFTVTSI